MKRGGSVWRAVHDGIVHTIVRVDLDGRYDWQSYRPRSWLRWRGMDVAELAKELLWGGSYDSVEAAKAAAEDYSQASILPWKLYSPLVWDGLRGNIVKRSWGPTHRESFVLTDANEHRVMAVFDSHHDAIKHL